MATVGLAWRANPDQPPWPGAPAAAGYVERLAVLPERQGRGYGGALLAWAAGEALRRGCDRLRLDCWAGNARLRRWYDEQGFCAADEVGERAWRVARYERALQSSE